MFKSNNYHKLGMLSLFLTIITVVITVTINAYPLYVFEVKYLNLLDWVDLSQSELLTNYRQLMGYLNIPWHQELILTDFPVSASGALHFYEVKKLFMLNYSILLVTIIPTILFCINLVKTNQIWRLVMPFRVAAMVPVVLGFVMLMGFDQFFVGFHSLFFNNDAWLFDPVTDPIINVLPETYFMHCFILGFGLLELILLLGIYFGKKTLRSL
ncbi:TIGR01906 family membrane protein [Vagococcus intermedius]|uniref:TIGR01906 family membrane protein n=1 Tax=Vagococcus intermedius TaxID=2991418 RepID=A0AAF0I6V3_9ENTE|nr:TIGR01906 family membrane protein [Vagococcus intermedius]WEG72915.1 TIGR01906 family membrane protein [Vagococcus intermedius]WEG75002.1 TIGR01906 family membrane protein [Vagococcus intermedius]